MNTTKEYLYNQLGFFYTKFYVSEQLTDQPSDELDIDAFLAEKPRCWRGVDEAEIKAKKSLIINSWYLRYLYDSSLHALTRFFGDLIDEGFTVYVPGDDALMSITDKVSLRSQLSSAKSIDNTMALKWAAKQQISNQQACIIDTQRLGEIATGIEEAGIYQGEDEYIHNLSSLGAVLPDPLNPQQMQHIEQFIQPNDKVGYVFNPDTASLLPVQLKARINALTVHGVAADDTPKCLPFILSIADQLTALDLNRLDGECLAAIMKATPNLTSINIINADCFGYSDLNLKPGELSHLTKLFVASSIITATQLLSLIKAAPNLTSIDILNCNNIDFALFNLELGELIHLTELNLFYSSINANQLLSLIKAAPNLTSINVSGCKNIDFALLNLEPKELSHLTKLDVSSSSINANQLSSLIKAAPNLTSIDVSSCENIDFALLNLKPGELSHLTELKVSATSINAKQLLSLIKAAPNLTSINVSGCNSTLAI